MTDDTKDDNPMLDDAGDDAVTDDTAMSPEPTNPETEAECDLARNALAVAIGDDGHWYAVEDPQVLLRQSDRLLAGDGGSYRTGPYLAWWPRWAADCRRSEDELRAIRETVGRGPAASLVREVADAAQGIGTILGRIERAIEDIGFEWRRYRAPRSFDD